MKQKSVTFRNYKGIVLSPDAIEKCTLAMRAVLHCHRQALLKVLLNAPDGKTVTELFIAVRLEQSVVSQDLAALRRSELVVGERTGKSILYKLNPIGIEKLAKFVCAINGVELKNANDTIISDSWGASIGEHAISLLRGLNNEIRLNILEFIDRVAVINPKIIYRNLYLEQSICSSQLKILREAEIVNGERKGKEVFYSINYPLLEKINNAIIDFAQ
jgi:DNA-binding transcriptional ArsR family regulator